MHRCHYCTSTKYWSSASASPGLVGTFFGAVGTGSTLSLVQFLVLLQCSTWKRHLLNDSPKRITVRDHQHSTRAFCLQRQQGVLESRASRGERFMYTRECHLANVRLHTTSSSSLLAKHGIHANLEVRICTTLNPGSRGLDSKYLKSMGGLPSDG